MVICKVGDGMRRMKLKAVRCKDDDREQGMDERGGEGRLCVHFEWGEGASPFSRAELSNEPEGDGARFFLERSGCRMFQTVLKNMTTTATEKITAVTIPITTLGIALTPSDGRKAIIKPVHTSLITAKYPARISAFLVSYGLRTMILMKTRPSRMTRKMACASPCA